MFLSLQGLDFLDGAHSDVAEAFAHGLEERVAEGVHEDGVDAADALDLDQVGLDARHHGPDVDEGEDGEEDPPDQSERDAHQRREQPVAPVLGDGESGEAGLPHAIEAVGARGFSDHVLKVHLDHVVVDVLGVAVDQIDLLRVHILHRLLVQALVVHVLVVWFVDVSLFADERRVQKLLWKSAERQ